jgi:hypothetical protein
VSTGEEMEAWRWFCAGAGILPRGASVDWTTAMASAPRYPAVHDPAVDGRIWEQFRILWACRPEEDRRGVTDTQFIALSLGRNNTRPEVLGIFPSTGEAAAHIGKVAGIFAAEVGRGGLQAGDLPTWAILPVPPLPVPT